MADTSIQTGSPQSTQWPLTDSAAGFGGKRMSISRKPVAHQSHPSITIQSDEPPPVPKHQPPPPPVPPHQAPPVPLHEPPPVPPHGRQLSTDTFDDASSWNHSRDTSRDIETPEPDRHRDSAASQVPIPQTIRLGQAQVKNVSTPISETHSAEIHSQWDNENSPPRSRDEYTTPVEEPEQYPALQYHHQPYASPQKAQQVTRQGKPKSTSSGSGRSSSDKDSASIRSGRSGRFIQVPRSTLARPSSAYTLGSELNVPGRSYSPRLSMAGSPVSNGSPRSNARPMSANRRSPDVRPISYIDLLNTPYAQQVAPSGGMLNTGLRQNVGTNAALLDTKKTLEMYRLNVKKTADSSLQYEFAVFMVNAAKDTIASNPNDVDTYNDLLRESRQMLQRLSDRSYPFAQYYLGDGYASGLFNKGKQDWDRAFPLFVAASKHGHAEAGYRAALCYEFGWGSRKDYAKAVQFYRASASKNHPGAAVRLGKACLANDMGLVNKYREGLKWMKRAAESADMTYNSGPYELGLLHETGFGPDCFKDVAYAAQLFTQSADLGHPEANMRMGEAYEHGKLLCPRDPALSLHFYHTAAQAGLPDAMMCVCAWYMVGAPPVLDKDENEAYEWARKAAETGMTKAEYAVGYFTEMGIGCRRDPLEANVWYVRAADNGDERAKQRLAIIRAAASGDPGIPSSESVGGGANTLSKKKGDKNDKECVVM